MLVASSNYLYVHLAKCPLLGFEWALEVNWFSYHIPPEGLIVEGVGLK